MLGPGEQKQSFHTNIKGTVQYAVVSNRDGSRRPLCLGYSPSSCAKPLEHQQRESTYTLGQMAPSSIINNNYTLEAGSNFTYLGSTITNNLSLDAKISSWIGKAASTFEKLTTRVWDNSKPTSIQKCRCTEPVSSAHSCMAAKPGPYNHTKSGGKTPSTCAPPIGIVRWLRTRF